ncbi:MAG: hypothetical protein A2V70_17530 [Planctomycetes bacterium RBG_13_63_9]|nr:MAG: hypothetical protein A2V70_17530 [Planctomycetes bacterium RBG_13_63_9]
MGAVLERMDEAGRIALSDRGIALAGHGPQLSDKDRELVDEMVEIYRRAGYQPPTVAELKGQVSRNQAAVAELVQLAARDGRLVEISSQWYLDAEAERQMRTTLADRLGQADGLTVSQIREILKTTRKYAVPLCEYLDRVGFTKREGDVRKLGTQYQLLTDLEDDEPQRGAIR